MKDGDLVVTPEPATRTILLGRVAGPYRYLEEPIARQRAYVSARSRGTLVRVRVQLDQLPMARGTAPGRYSH